MPSGGATASPSAACPSPSRKPRHGRPCRSRPTCNSHLLRWSRLASANRIGPQSAPAIAPASSPSPSPPPFSARCSSPCSPPPSSPPPSSPPCLSTAAPPVSLSPPRAPPASPSCACSSRFRPRRDNPSPPPPPPPPPVPRTILCTTSCISACLRARCSVRLISCSGATASRASRGRSRPRARRCARPHEASSAGDRAPVPALLSPRAAAVAVADAAAVAAVPSPRRKATAPAALSAARLSRPVPDGTTCGPVSAGEDSSVPCRGEPPEASAVAAVAAAARNGCLLTRSPSQQRLQCTCVSTSK